jgi:hypothetical protein
MFAMMLTTTTGNCDVGVAFSGVTTFIVKPCDGKPLSRTHLFERRRLTIFTIWSYIFIHSGHDIVDVLFQLGVQSLRQDHALLWAGRPKPMGLVVASIRWKGFWQAQTPVGRTMGMHAD